MFSARHRTSPLHNGRMHRFRRLLGQVGLFLATAVLVLAVDLKVGTLNCYLLFDPAIDHTGKVDDENRLQPAEYQTKLSNLSTLASGYEVVAIQETGGRPEITALAAKAKLDWFWTKGKDTATGEEVGLLYRLPGWKVAAVTKPASRPSTWPTGR